jgi:hypothetical protein
MVEDLTKTIADRTPDVTCSCTFIKSPKWLSPKAQSTYIPRVPQCLSTRPNWDPPAPSPASECVPIPGTKGGGNTLACKWGGGGVPIPDDLKKSLALCTATKILFYIPFLGTAGPQSQFPHSCVCDLYIPRIGPLISCSRIGRSIVGIYKQLTDTWMLKLRLRPRHSFSGNICFEFSVLVLCSVSTLCP